MKLSPFPGMDPYLEKHWGDVHHSLIQYTRDALQPQLPADLRARVEERVFLENAAPDDRHIVPDVHIGRTPGFDPPAGWRPEETAEDGGVAVAEPLIFDSVEITEGYIEIRDSTGEKLITVIEFVSPTNKRAGDGRKEYLKKQREVLNSDTSLVEIDLTRQGKSVVALPHDEIPQVKAAAYVASICPGWESRRREVFPISLRKRLPILPIPLREGEPRVNLDLQQLIDQVYTLGRYELTDYSQPVEPALPAEDAEWARAFFG